MADQLDNIINNFLSRQSPAVGGTLTPQSVGAFNPNPGVATQGFRQAFGPATQPTSPEALRLLAEQGGNSQLLGEKFKALGSSQAGFATLGASVNPLMGLLALLGVAGAGGFAIDKSLRQEPFNTTLPQATREGLRTPVSSLQSGLAAILNR